MMYLNNYADQRQIGSCAYCGESQVKLTRDHSPSKVFLNKPYPTNLYVVPACLTCNNNFSFDEEYIAYWIEIALYKLYKIRTDKYDKVIRAIERTPSLKAKFLQTTLFDENDLVPIEESRLQNVLYKLASGHILFHQNNPKYETPTSINWFLLESLSELDRSSYEQEPFAEVYPEIGSRTILKIDQYGNLYYPWIYAQQGIYRYLVADIKNSQVVKIVFSEFLACEVIWNDL